jgi:hypothetical protein
MSRRGKLWLRALLSLLGAAGLGCAGQPPTPAPATQPPVWFEDVTRQVGLDFVHDAGPVDGRYFMPQIMGSGCALFDMDGDGRLDLYLLNNGGPQGAPNQLFHQERDGTFRNVSAGSGLDFADYCLGVAVGDVNNDGLPDVLVTGYGWIRLFLNEGKGKFTDVTGEAGMDNPLWAVSAAFFDYDRDGWLDLVVVNYIDYDPARRCSYPSGKGDYCHPDAFPTTVTRLFRNLGQKRAGGERVRFEDRTLAAGLGRAPGPGLGVACADFNGDGWPDILVANDSRPNHLWINQKDGTFREQGLVSGLAVNVSGQAQANMGIALGDVNGDGRPDVFITHLGEETHTLWLQEPRGCFRDRTAGARLANPDWHGTGFGTVLADFDHDGALDLAVVNGRVRAGAPQNEAALGPFWARYAERNQLFANDGKGVFRDVSAANPAFCGTPGVFRGLAVGDVDGDGALDLVVTATAGRARLFRNVAPKRGHWLGVQALVGNERKRDAYGAEVTVEAGGRRWVGLLCPGQSYGCSHAPAVHFGLGAAAQVDALDVLWPDGTRETFSGRPADQVVVLRQGEGVRASR